MPSSDIAALPLTGSCLLVAASADTGVEAATGLHGRVSGNPATSPAPFGLARSLGPGHASVASCDRMVSGNGRSTERTGGLFRLRRGEPSRRTQFARSGCRPGRASLLARRAC